MPSPGNHENELGNGPIGYQAYQTYFALPRQPARPTSRAGLWYAFTVGSVRVVEPRQRRRLLPGRRQLLRPRLLQRRAEGVARDGARRRPRATATSTGSWSACTRSPSAPPTSSTAPTSASARSGCRCSTSTGSTSWSAGTSTTTSARTRSAAARTTRRSPRSRSRPPPTSSTPPRAPCTWCSAAAAPRSPSNQLFFNPPACRVITAVGAPDPTTGKRPPVYVTGARAWSAVRDAAHAYGFAAFTVDPGARPAATTTIKVTYYDVIGPGWAVRPVRELHVAPSASRLNRHGSPVPRELRRGVSWRKMKPAP